MKEEEIKKDEVRVNVTRWGARINVSFEVMQHLQVGVGDVLTWKLTEDKGKPIAVLRKEEKESTTPP